MCSKEEEQFLLLFQFVKNSGADVVRDYIDRKITESHGSFVTFLAEKKHFFHHQVNGKLFCCECPPAGCSMKIKGKMMREFFQKMYLANKDSFDSSHNVYKNGFKETVCICGYKEKSEDISDFDISCFHWLISDLSILPNDRKMIKNFIDVRNSVAHAIDSKVFNATDLQRLWDQVEKSLKVINCSPRFIKRIINDAKKKILCGEEVEKLTTAVVEKFMEDKRNVFLNNNSVTDGFTAQNEESGIKLDEVAKEVHEIKALLQIHMNKKTVTVGIQCDNEVAARENGNSSISTPESTNPDAQMTLKGLEHSEEITLIENSNNQEKEAGYENQPSVDILKGRVGSVVLDLKIRSDVFDSPVKLRTELIVAIKKVLQMGNINTNVEGTITINVLFLNSLTEAQKEIVQRLLVQSTVEDSAASVITTTSTDILSREGKQLPTVNISTCSSCVEKDKMVGLLENQLLLEKRKYEMLTEGSSKMEKSKQPPTKKQDEKKGEKGRSCKMYSLVLLTVIVAVAAVLYGNGEYREKTFESVAHIERMRDEEIRCNDEVWRHKYHQLRRTIYKSVKGPFDMGNPLTQVAILCCRKYINANPLKRRLFDVFGTTEIEVEFQKGDTINQQLDNLLKRSKIVIIVTDYIHMDSRISDISDWKYKKRIIILSKDVPTNTVYGTRLYTNLNLLHFNFDRILGFWNVENQNFEICIKLMIELMRLEYVQSKKIVDDTNTDKMWTERSKEETLQKTEQK